MTTGISRNCTYSKQEWMTEWHISSQTFRINSKLWVPTWYLDESSKCKRRYNISKELFFFKKFGHSPPTGIGYLSLSYSKSIVVTFSFASRTRRSHRTQWQKSSKVNWSNDRERLHTDRTALTLHNAEATQMSWESTTSLVAPLTQASSYSTEKLTTKKVYSCMKWSKIW